MTTAQDTSPLVGPEALALLNGLTNSAPPPGYHASWDRVRDFRAVFLGSPQGLRVLSHMMKKAGVMNTPVRSLGNGIDVNATFHMIGQEDYGRWLLEALTVEPKDQPSTAISEENEE